MVTERYNSCTKVAMQKQFFGPTLGGKSLQTGHVRRLFCKRLNPGVNVYEELDWPQNGHRFRERCSPLESLTTMYSTYVWIQMHRLIRIDKLNGSSNLPRTCFKQLFSGYLDLSPTNTIRREHSMQLVEKHCAKYLDMFVECIQNYPHTWQMDCEPERSKLARCAETNPEIVHIKTTGSQQFQLYEQCMMDNKVDPEKCTDLFSTFTSCADEALKTIPTEDNSNQKETASGSR